jgi:OOP family OmpA-OmpF porin
MKNLKTSFLAALVATAALLSGNVLAANAFGDLYQPVTAVPDSQSQVVYYRTLEQEARGAANVYVDGEFQTALLPGGFNVFCLKPGAHSLGNFINDAPLYNGKRQQAWTDNFTGGKTYFIRLGNGSTGQPAAVSRQQAEQELIGTQQQIHTLSRASSVVACDNNAPRQYKDYVLAGDVLFTFGKSSTGDISAAGRKAVGQLIAELHRDHAELKAIEVIGHTDPIGKEQANLALGQRRAETVRQMLVDGGIPADILRASSAGSSELVVDNCEGSKAAKIQCNAPNRRVVVRVDIEKAE